MSKIGPRVGYMPQELALVGELTVKETIFYFGNIFLMEIGNLSERYEMIHNLLELPPDDQSVSKCSGGQKRRISFAAAIIHEPELLILDEPTVGLDPLLREKVWNFLSETTRATKLSVIITTHYIAEVQKSDFVGLMRNGSLLAEDSPISIMSRYDVKYLDEAFLQMCLFEKKISSSEVAEKNAANDFYDIVYNDDESSCDDINVEIDEKNEKKTMRWQIVKELMKKHTRKFQRTPA